MYTRIIKNILKNERDIYQNQKKSTGTGFGNTIKYHFYIKHHFYITTTHKYHFFMFCLYSSYMYMYIYTYVGLLCGSGV